MPSMPLATACRDLVKQVDLVAKLAARLVDAAEMEVKQSKENGDGNHDNWDGRAIGRLEKELDAQRKERGRATQADGLLPAPGALAAVRDSRTPSSSPSPGFAEVVTRAEIEAADWSLTPGRYVGVAPPEVDEDFDFEQALRDIHVELADLNQEACDTGGQDSGELRGAGNMKWRGRVDQGLCARDL